jgi:hypothetical protein
VKRGIRRRRRRGAQPSLDFPSQDIRLDNGLAGRLQSFS